jgi:hypothetical protein
VKRIPFGQIDIEDKRAVPRNYSAARALLGDPHQGSQAVERRCVLITEVPLACTTKLYVHEQAAPYLVDALRRCIEAGVEDEIRSLGCYNHRRIRHSHDPAAPFSYHAFAAAVDINPRENRLKWPTKPIESFGLRWRWHWPRGLSRTLVECWEAAGWTWGGRWTRPCDPMHWQLPKM